MVAEYYAETVGFTNDALETFLLNNVFIIRSIFFIFTTFWVSAYLWEWMYMSYAFKDSGMNIEVAKLVLDEKEDDVTKLFFNSNIGKFTLARLGIRDDEFKKFLNERKSKVTKEEYVVIENDDDPYISLSEYGSSLLHYDYDLKGFFYERDITMEMFKETLEWVSELEEKRLKKETWWSEENLSRIPSIGRRWTKGKIKTLKQFGDSIYDMSVYKTLGDKWHAYSFEIDKLEQILVKDKDSNVMLISSDNQINMEIVGSFAKAVANGTIHPKLESKRIYFMDWREIMFSYKRRDIFERELKSILKESSKASDMFLVINDFSSFIEELNNIDADALSIFEEVLESEKIQVVVLSDIDEYRKTVEPDVNLIKKFRRVDVSDLNRDHVLDILKEQALNIEEKEKIFFTYPGILVIADLILKKYPKAMSHDIVKILKQVSGEVILSDNRLANRQSVVEALNNIHSESKKGIES
jgi:ATP-dependent Clp protease ATP-binding subunit ClpA